MDGQNVYCGLSVLQNYPFHTMVVQVLECLTTVVSDLCFPLRNTDANFSCENLVADGGFIEL